MSDLGITEKLLSGSGGGEQKPATDLGLTERLISSGPGQSLTAAPKDTKFGRPYIVDDPDRSVPLFTLIKAGAFPDEKKQIKFLAQETGIPENRWGVIDGNVIYIDDRTGDIVRAVPSVANASGPVDLWHRFSKWAASQVGPSVPTAVGGAAGTAMGPTPASIPVAAGAAGVADIARQAVGNAMLDEPLSDIDYLNAAGQAAMGGVGQGVGMGVAKAFNRNPLNVGAYDRKAATDPATLAAAQANQAQAQAEGIPLSFGQATGLRSARNAERQLSRDPVSTDIMSDFYKKQRGQIGDATSRFIDSVSPVQSVDEGVNAMRSGASAAVETARETRRTQSRPLYESVMRPDNVMPARDFNSLMANDGIVAGALKRVRSDEVLSASIEGMPDASLPVLDLVKKNLDDAYDVAKRAGEGNRARIIGDARDKFVKTLDDAFKGYADARQAFAGASPEVDSLVNGAVGTLEKKEGTERIGQIRSLFNSNLSNPAAVGKARASYEKAGRLDDWDAGVATYLRDTLNAATKVDEGVSPQRLVTALYERQQQRDLLKAAMTPDQFDGFTRLLHVIQNAARTLPENSATATDLAGGKALRDQFGGAAKLIGGLTSAIRLADAGGAVGDKVALRMSDAGIERLANAVTNPGSVEQLKKLRMLPPSGEKAVLVASQILGLTGSSSLGLRDPADVEPKSP